MRRFTHRTNLAALAIAILVGVLLASTAIQAREFAFVAQESGKGTATWLPGIVVIDAATDLEGGLEFILINPTNRAHVFAVHDLFEVRPAEEGREIVESDPATYVLEPIRVEVPKWGIWRIRVGSEMLKRHRMAGQRLKFFCPKHTRHTRNGAIWMVG